MSRPRPGRRLRTTLALGALLLAAPARLRADEAADEAKYRAELKRPSLHKRMQARVRFARTGSSKALSILADDYLKAEEPKDHVRYLLATLATETLTNSKDALPVLAAWREKAKTALDAWLWHRALAAEALLESKSVFETARDPVRPAILRAAALHALTTSVDPERLATTGEVLSKLPKAEPDRSLLLEACAAVVRGFAPFLKDDAAARDLVAAVAKTLDDRTFSLDTRDIVARRLANLFQTDVLGEDSKPWLRELAAAESKPASTEVDPEVKYAPGPFFGLRALGRRVVYVIDVSDSMLEPLSPEELRALKPVTEADAPLGKDGKPLPKPKKDAEEPLPWQKIRNRLDAAREVLKRSLRATKPDRSFCVVLFGDDARTLAATPNLVPADPKTLAAAIAELDRMTPVPAPGDKLRPHGKLRGETNLHGGIRLAFKVTTKGRFGVGEYAELEKIGCDAVFVLSDGVPSTDDFRKDDKRDPEDKAVKDRETMAPTADTPMLRYTGPYGYPSWEDFVWIVDDVRRMNLFRQAEIHCVALGEASDTILRSIADYGGGRFVRVGEASGK